MHFRLKSISILSSLKLRSRYLISIALELFIEMTPRRSSLLNTLLGLRDRLVAISSMEFPASKDSTSWFSSAWLHRLLAMTGWGFRASWYSASVSFSIAKRNASWVSSEKKLDLKVPRVVFWIRNCSYKSLQTWRRLLYFYFTRSKMYMFFCDNYYFRGFKNHKRKNYLRLMSYKF